MKALILAAGYATRLYPLTKDYPKPLLEVKGRPIVDYILDKLKNIDVLDEIIVVTNSKFFRQFKKWKLGLRIKKKITLVDDLTKGEKTKLGAVGDINFAIQKKLIREDLLVIGGDNLFDGNLGDFLVFAKSRAPHVIIGAYDVKNRLKAKKYGVINLNRQNKIIKFQEKPKSPKSALVAMCLYYFPKGKLNLIRRYLALKTNKHDATGLYIDWLSKKDSVYSFIFTKRWYDIGDRGFYNEAKKAFAE